MGKILILTFSDSEEPIMDKILTAVEGEPTMEHIANRHTPSVLTFPNLEIRINEQIIYHDNHPVPLTHHEFFTWLNTRPGFSRKSRSTKQSGKRPRSIAGRRWRMWCIPLDGRSEMGT